MINYIKKMITWVPYLKKTFIVAGLFKILEALIMGSPYCFIFLTLNHLFLGTLTGEKIMHYTLGMAFCFMLQGVFSFMFIKKSWPGANFAVRDLRLMIGEHLRKLSMGYYSKKTTGSIHTLVADEMYYVQMGVYKAYPDFLNALVFSTIIPFFLLFIDWRLTIAASIVIPLSLPFYIWEKNILSKGMKERSKKIEDVNSEIIDYVQGIEVLKAFNHADEKYEKLEKKLKELRDTSIRIVIKGDVPMSLVYIVLDMGLCITLFFSCFFLFEKSISMAFFLMFPIICLRLYEPMKQVFPSLLLLKLTEPPMEKIDNLFNEEPLKDSGILKPELKNGIEFKEVSFGYEDKMVLNNINIKIPHKKITALVGPSGSGKTTITRLIARFWDVVSGEIQMDGEDIRNFGIDDLLSQISMVFQDVYLFNDTIYQNIAYGCKTPDREKIIEAAKIANCHEFIEKLPLGYDTIVGEGGATLSGGEKQRISIARAIGKDAPIILLDEATASVDPENEHLIQEAINKLVKSKTLVIIAHRLSTIKEADQIIVLNSKGSVEEMGIHDDLMLNNGLYSILWNQRVKSGKWAIKNSGD